MMKAATAAAAAILLIPVLFLGALAAGGEPRPVGFAVGGSAAIPQAMWDLYAEAGARFDVPPALLAAVGKVECDHNRNPACTSPNSAGAVGPMQFLPSTFAAYASASGSPYPSILHPRDAVFAAAAKLAADGAAVHPEQALYSYNHSHAYVATVEAWGVAYGWAPPDAGVLARAVLDHPRLDLRTGAAEDVRRGAVDARVLGLVLVLATRFDLGLVGPFVSGHSTPYISNHDFGRAVDLPLVDDRPVTTQNSAARSAVEVVMTMPPALRPTEVGCPWLISVEGTSTFTEGHHDHLHFAWDA